MIILTIRTDKPEAELGLYQDRQQLAHMSWQAHRQLAETIHLKIKSLLDGEKYKPNKIEAIAVFKGPGSFTGLRIGLSVANALADSLNVPIVSEGGESWITDAVSRLRKGGNEQIALPEYGAPPHITQQKH
jgi:tRNA threonylcarbamoyladenosine biosynthesis protein TsaB